MAATGCFHVLLIKSVYRASFGKMCVCVCGGGGKVTKNVGKVRLMHLSMQNESRQIEM